MDDHVRARPGRCRPRPGDPHEGQAEVPPRATQALVLPPWLGSLRSAGSASRACGNVSPTQYFVYISRANVSVTPGTHIRSVKKLCVSSMWCEKMYSTPSVVSNSGLYSQYSVKRCLLHSSLCPPPILGRGTARSRRSRACRMSTRRGTVRGCRGSGDELTPALGQQPAGLLES